MIRKIHHVGIAVRDLEESWKFYRDTLGLSISKMATVEDQGVRASLHPLGEAEIELLVPIDPAGGVARFLERRGEGLHHVCFETDDVKKQLEEAKGHGIPVIDQQPRNGLAGMICFLHPKANHGVLVELAQPFPEDSKSRRHGDAMATGRIRVNPGSGISVTIAVRSIAEAGETFRRNFGFSVQSLKEIPTIAMRRTLLPVGNSSIILLQPTDANSDVARFLATRGEGLFHIVIPIENFPEAVSLFESQGLTVGRAQDANGRSVAHLSPTQTHGVFMEFCPI